MDIFKIIGICFITLIISLILKEYKKEYAVYVLIVCGIIIISYAMDTIKEIISFLNGNKEIITKPTIFILIPLLC